MTSMAISNQALNDLSATEAEINAPRQPMRKEKKNKTNGNVAVYSQSKPFIKWWLTAPEGSRHAQDPANVLLVQRAIVK